MTYLVVEADGGSRGNPGVAGYGALVRDPASGKVLAERAAPLGKASNNVAEYTGLIEGLKAAEAVSPGARIEVKMDSKLVVEQMSGRWKIKHADMRRLADEAREIVAEITASGGSVTFTWIPRDRNKAADALSNTGMDGETVHRDFAPGGTSDVGTDADTGHDDAPGHSGDAAVESVADVLDVVDVADESARHSAPPTRTVTSADLGAPTRVVIVRHGVTDHNVAGRVTGRGGEDPPLNAEGAHQARRAAEAIAAAVGDGDAVVLTSSLARAQQTASLIATRLGVEPVVDAGWDEQSVGEWDGLTWAEIAATDGDAPARARSDERFSAPGGESFAQLRTRVRRGWEGAAHGDRAVVIVTHRGPVDAVLSELLGVPRGMAARLGAVPGSLMWLRVWADRGFMIDRLNDDAHLR
ncbi:MAG: bifunctional RNase H/acid phosphatase [Dermatophilus congolensis]|nr:bifunctional RNase H/acid phosphatase [Dermatophilus congolensis]